MSTNTPELTADERLRAIQEADRIAAADSYFEGHPSLDTYEGRRIYAAAFDRAYALLSRLRQGGEPVAWFIDWPDEPELGHYIAESPADSGRSRPLVFADASPQESTPVSEEPVYAYRRKGLDDFVTCDRQRFDELSAKPRLFETRIFYAAPPASVPVAGEAATQGLLKLRGYHALVQVVYELRQDGNYSDDEGEETDALEELIHAIEANAAPQASAACATDVCRAGHQDGVLCANDECDRSNGVRPAPQPADDGQPHDFDTKALEVASSVTFYGADQAQCQARAKLQVAVRDAMVWAVLADRQQRAALGSKEKNDAK